MPDQSEDESYQNKYLELPDCWNLEKLYEDLALSKQKNFPGRPKKLSHKEKACLRGFLKNQGPKEMATEFGIDFNGLRVDLTKGLYRFIEDLTGQPFENWWNIPEALKQAGYEFPPIAASTITNEREIAAASNKAHQLSQRVLELEIGLSSESSEFIADLLKDIEHVTNTFQPEQHSQIKFNITQHDYETAEEEFRKPNAYDIIMLDDPWIPSYWDSIYPLSEEVLFIKYLSEQGLDEKSLFGQKFIESFRHVCVHQKQVAALPMLGNVQLLIHRCDVQRRMNHEVDYQLNRKLDHINLSPLQDFYSSVQGTEICPLVIRDDTDNEIVEIFWEILRSLDHEDSYNEHGAVIIDIDKAKKASDWMYNRSTDPTTDRYRYSVGIGFEKLQESLLAENSNIAVALGWPGWISGSLSKDTSILNEIEFQRLAKHPVMGVWCLALPRQPKHSEYEIRQYAMRVILALTTDPQIQFLLARRGNIPVLADFFRTKKLREIPFWRNNYCTIRDALLYSLPRPRSKHWFDFEHELATQIRTGCFKDISGKVAFSSFSSSEAI
jgi:hypothetical protein